VTLSAGATLRRILNERRAVLVPGVMNALAARIADDEKFEALYVTGAGLTNAFMGKPDVGLIDLTQLSLNLSMIRDVTELPLIVDADTGFGNAVNVHHTVRALERAGANAIQLEDQSMPKRCGHFDGKSVISTEEMGQKIRAAVDARKSEDLLIVARTDALASQGLDAAIERAEHFIECGADVTFVEAPSSIADFRVICSRLPVPQLANIVIGGKTAPASLEDLAAAGVGMALYANAALQGAMLGMQLALRRLRDDGMLREDSGVVVNFKERQRLVGKPEIDALEQAYSTN
jgi:2-methylisocitrate lyase-like PEP mutase family enzyme